MNAARRAIFLDRDGVLNRAVVRDGKPYPPQSVDELEVLPGVVEALDRLRSTGYLLVGVTNQPDVARGTQRREVVEAINARLREALPLDALYVCYEDGTVCPRRKPNPGMLLEAAEAFGIDLAGSFMVGDRWSDVEAGRRAGCRTIFIARNYAERLPDPPADFAAPGLREATDWILNDFQKGTGPLKSRVQSPFGNKSDTTGVTT
jgi:D-glycero-D-manno-heptose 1,7-bisphosphate phosphatase